MLWIEMWRDDEDRETGWGFGRCLWSPAYKNDNRKSRWAYWDSLLQVKKGDQILHLRGKEELAGFAGFSTAASDGYETKDKPVNPGRYAYADLLHRVDLTDFVQIAKAEKLRNIFKSREPQLRDYFRKNKARPAVSHLHLFYVIQGGRLQCQNGAYLSEADSELLSILLGEVAGNSDHKSVHSTVSTGQAERMLQVRIGQQEFAEAVLSNYGGRCCFPGCDINDCVFLIGSHIARWADAPDLRGDIKNGLSLCLMHDCAFEHGLFTLGPELNVIVDSHPQPRWACDKIIPFAGRQIISTTQQPSPEILRHHWDRNKFSIPA
jgi:putative restriction endonuclease